MDTATLSKKIDAGFYDNQINYINATRMSMTIHDSRYGARLHSYSFSHYVLFP